MDDGYLSPARRELDRLIAEARDADERVRAASQLLNDRYEKASPAMRARLESELAAAKDDASRAAQAAKVAESQQPAAVAKRIYDKAQAARAPRLTTWDWWRENPGFLTSVSKHDRVRQDDARSDAFLTELDKAAKQSRWPYSLYEDPDTADLAIDAAMYAGNPELQSATRSPYYRSVRPSSELTGAASLGERLGERVAYAAGTALGPDHSIANEALGLMGRPQNFATGFRAAGQRLMEGNPYGAAMGVGQAFTGVMFPETAVDPREFHKYANPAASDAINMALDPLWYTGGGKALERMRYGRGIPTYLETSSGELIRRLPGTDPAYRVRRLLLPAP